MYPESMGTTLVDLRAHLHQALLECLKSQAATTRQPALEFEELDDDQSLFADHEPLFKHVRGFFNYDQRELRTRRLDMRGPLDLDPGPIEMEEADPGAEAIQLDFGG